MAAFLRYRRSNNGSYLARVAAARMFDFVMGEGSRLTISPRAQTILMPVYKEQVEQGLLDAFMGVPLYKDVYDEYPVPRAAALVGIRPSTAKRHPADLRARSGLTTAQLIYSDAPLGGSSFRLWSPPERRRFNVTPGC